MGKIEMIGIIDDSYSFGQVNVPDDANVLKADIDNLNPINQLFFWLPIILCLLIPMIIKQRKYGLFNKEEQIKIKEENIKRYKLDTTGKKVGFVIKEYLKIVVILMIVSLLSMPIHEIFHAIAGAIFGADMKVGFIYQMFAAVAITSSKLSKMQYLILLLTPVTILGIIPAILILLNYPKKIKNAKLAWIALTACIIFIMTTGPDLISSFNIIKNVPNGAVMQQTDNNMFWYMQKNK